MVVLIIFPLILQTVINVIMLSIGGQGALLCGKCMHQFRISTVFGFRVSSLYMTDGRTNRRAKSVTRLIMTWLHNDARSAQWQTQSHIVQNYIIYTHCD